MAFGLGTDTSTINATAGTSLVIAKPTGVVAGVFMVAIVAVATQTTITAPAGWTQAGTADAGANLRSRVYYKFAGSSEGTNYTWTFGASARNEGFIFAATGVDTTTPIPGVQASTYTSGTAFTPTDYPMGLDNLDYITEQSRFYAAVALRTAGGSATTWSASIGVIESEDISTNAGSGLDISGATYYAAWTEAIPTITASQSQTQVIVWSIVLKPLLATPAASELMTVRTYAAFGADPDDEETWVFTEITNYVRHADGITLSRGRRTAHGEADPASLSFKLDNRDGRFTPYMASSPYYPNIRRGLPIRVMIDNVGVNPPYERALCFVDSWRPGWDDTSREAFMEVEAFGRLRRLGQQSTESQSPVYVFYRSLSPQPAGYWPLEDGAASTSAAEAFGRGVALAAGVQFAADDTLEGSGPLPMLSTSSYLSANLEAYTSPSPNRWSISWMLHLDAVPGVENMLMDVFTTDATGSIVRWVFSLDSTTFRVRGYDGLGGLVGTVSSVYAAQLVGGWSMIRVTAAQNGANVDVTVYTVEPDGGTNSFSGSIAATLGNVRAWRFLAGTGLDGAGVGHVAIYTGDPANLLTSRDEMEGMDGEHTYSRWYRVLAQTDYGNYVYYGDDSFSAFDQTMGPQPRVPLIDILREIQDAEVGLIHDGDDYGRLALVTRSYKANQVPWLYLNNSLGQLAPGLSPSYDADVLVNDFTASQPGGTSARFTDDASIAAEGRAQGSLAVNVQKVEDLFQHASWRVALGTVPELRIPQVNLNLRSSPELIYRYIHLFLGDRISITNLPSTYPNRTADVFVEGLTETLYRDSWTATLDCSPGYSYNLLTLDSDSEITEDSKLDTDGSTLYAAISSSATSMDVVTTSGPLWTTDDAQFPISLNVAGEKITATDIAASTITAVSAGTVAHGNNATVIPGLPAGLAVGDLLLCFAAIRNSGTGVPNTPANGMVRLPVFPANSNVQLFGKIAEPTGSTTTVSFTGGVANADTSAQLFAVRGKFSNINNVVSSASWCLNTSAQNITYPGLTIWEPNCVVFYLGWKQDDWTSVATISGATEIGEPSTTTGDDQGIVWDYAIQTTATHIGSGEFAVTGGASAISRGSVVAIRCDRQTFTVTRGVNQISKAQVAGEAVKLWQPRGLSL